MAKNCKWGIFPGKWGAKAKKAAPCRIKNGGSLPRNPKADISRDASRFRRSGAPSPAGTNVPAGDGAPEAIRPVPNTLRGAFVSAEARERQNGIPRMDSRQRSGNVSACGQRAYTPRAAKRRRFQSRKQCPRIKRITDRRIADRRSFQDAGSLLLSETPYLSRICTFARKSEQHQIKQTGVRNTSERLSALQPAEHQRPQEAVRPASFSIPHKPRMFFCLSLAKISFRRRYASTPRPTALRTKLPYYKSRARRKTGGPPAEAGGPPDGFALTRRRRSGRAPSP